MSKKVAFIGGGSYQWGIAIIRDMLVTKGLDGSRLVLMDIDKKAANDVRKAAEATQRRAKTKWKFETTDDRVAALKGADFVITCISTGGFDTMEHDINIPWSYGVHQTVGDTVGAGGLSRALRNIPVFTSIAKDINRHCPDAWVLNITNPMTTLTKTLSETVESGKVVGLCHEVYGGMEFIATMLGFDKKDPTFDVKVAGINHCIWLLGAWRGGRDIMPDFKKALSDKKLAEKGALKVGKTKEEFGWIWNGNAIKRWMLETTGLLPMVGDRHLCEFYGHFTNNVKELIETWGCHFTTIKDRRENWLPPMKQSTIDTGRGKKDIPLELSHEPVAPIMDAIANNETYLLRAGNLPNIGQISNLPLGSVVETPCAVTAGGIAPVAVGALPLAVAAALAGHAQRQDMIVKAAMSGDRSLALAALISDPMIQDASTAPRMLDEMMAANAAWLPQFRKGAAKGVKPPKLDCDTIHSQAKNEAPASAAAVKSGKAKGTKKSPPAGAIIPKEISGR